MTTPLRAAGTESATPDEEKPFRLSATAGYTYVSYPRERGEGLIDSRNQLELEPRLEAGGSGPVRGVVALDLRFDAADSSRSRFFVEEAYLQVTLASVDLRLGRQFIRWGQSEVRRPTDSFMRHDDRDFLDVREEPIDAARVWYDAGNWSLEGVWAPIFQEDLFPLDLRDRWSGLPPTTDLPGVGTVDLKYQTDHSGLPSGILESSQAGLRLARKQARVDWSVSWYYGFDRTPTFVDPELLAVNAASGVATVELTPIHERIQVLGADCAAVVRGFGLRAEGSYTFTADRSGSDPHVDDPYFRLVAGIDRTLTGFSPAHTVYWNVQYLLDTEVPRHGEENQVDVEPRFRHLYEQGLTWDLEYRLESEVTLALKGFVNLEEGDYVVRPELTWHPNDALTLVIGADLLAGGPETFFGSFERNTSLRGRLTVRF